MILKFQNWAKLKRSNPQPLQRCISSWRVKRRMNNFHRIKIFNLSEKNDFLRFLHEDADKVTKQTRDTHKGLKPIISSTNIKRWTCDKLYFLDYVNFLVDKSFPLNRTSQKSTLVPQSYQRVLSLHIAPTTHTEPNHTNGLKGRKYSMILL